MTKGRLVLSWGLRILIALGFLLASLGKLTSNIMVVEMFENWGYPKGVHLFIGAIELALAILILISKFLKIAIGGAIVLLVGALLTHFINDPISEIIRPMIFFILLGGIYYLNFYRKD